jgi:hypothetical protein
MMEDIERAFVARGVKRGGTLMFEAAVAYEVIEAARLARRPVLGIDCFILTESTTMPLLEHILDLSRAVSQGIDTWSQARRFIEERQSFGFFFEIVV